MSEIDLCGSSCAEVVQLVGVPCTVTWADGCPAATPPEGFTADSPISDLCPIECLDLCGSTCGDVLYPNTFAACFLTWEQGCGALAPPDGFTASSTLIDLCPNYCRAEDEMPQEQTGYTEVKSVDLLREGICRAEDGSILNGRGRGGVLYESECAAFCTELDDCEAYTWLWLGPPLSFDGDVCLLYGPGLEADLPIQEDITVPLTEEWVGFPGSAGPVATTTNAYDAVCRVKNQANCRQCDMGGRARQLLFGDLPCCE